MHICKLLYLDLLLSSAQNWEKCTFFDNLRIITQEGNMELHKWTHFFHLLLLLYLLVTFISEFENTQNSFWNSLPWSILVCKTIQFFAKSYWLRQLIIFSRKQTPGVTNNLYYVLSTRRSKIPIFLGCSSWTILKIEENFMQSLSAFLLLFWRQKKAFKSPFHLYFHQFIIEFFWFA